MSIKPVDLAKLSSKASNIYEAVVVAAKKARVLNEETKIEFNALVNTLTGGVEDEFDDRDNTEQLKISTEFESRQKPHLKAVDELLDAGIEYRYKDTED
jgi:hypothetical protein